MVNSMTTSMTSPPSTSGAEGLSPSGDGARLARAAVDRGTRLPHVAILGKAGAGKTTGAEYLARNYGYAILSFATLLKDVSAQIWGEDARKDREKLQRLGVAVREIDEDAWVNAALRSIRSDLPVVVDDCRFPNEYWALRERGFVFVRVEAPEETRIDRLQRNGKLQDISQLNHVSETSLDDVFADHRIVNVAGELAYGDEITDILQKELRRS